MKNKDKEFYGFSALIVGTSLFSTFLLIFSETLKMGHKGLHLINEIFFPVLIIIIGIFLIIIGAYYGIHYLS